MMIQSRYAQAAIARLRERNLDDDTFDKLEDDVFRQLLMYIEMLERKLEQVEVQANRRRMF
jgi:uracil phosphoribosyltransferase